MPSIRKQNVPNLEANVDLPVDEADEVTGGRPNAPKPHVPGGRLDAAVEAPGVAAPAIKNVVGPQLNYTPPPPQ